MQVQEDDVCWDNRKRDRKRSLCSNDPEPRVCRQSEERPFVGNVENAPTWTFFSVQGRRPTLFDIPCRSVLYWPTQKLIEKRIEWKSNLYLVVWILTTIKRENDLQESGWNINQRVTPQWLPSKRIGKHLEETCQNKAEAETDSSVYHLGLFFPPSVTWVLLHMIAFLLLLPWLISLMSTLGMKWLPGCFLEPQGVGKGLKRFIVLH